MNLYYIEKGNGKPIVFLHGNGEDHTYFFAQIDYFSNEYRVIAIDSRAHGKSPRGDGELSLSRFADDLFDFLTDKKLDSVILSGFSDGANVAMLFALKHPDMVEKLILNGGNIDPSGIKRSTQLPIEIGYKIASHFAKKSEKAKKNAEILGLMVNEPHILPEELSKLKMPTLVIVGTRDMVKSAHTELIANSLPNAKLAILKGDHFIAAKKPREFNYAVQEFLKADIAQG